MTTWKKLLSGILALILVLSLAGCEIGEIPAVVKKPPTTAAIPTESETEDPNQGTDPTEATETQVPPAPTKPQVKEDPTEETKPAQRPAATEPEAKPTQPAETTPPVTKPPETVPPTTQPPASTEPTQPPATEPPPTNPPATEPEATTPPTTPPATEPVKPEKKEIDIAAIESSANSYAQSLGFIIDTSMGKGNSGYYPPDYRPLESTEEGYRVAAELVDATKDQLNSRFSTEYSNVLVEEAYGYARVSCVVKFSHTDELGDWYYIYVLYG